MTVLVEIVGLQLEGRHGALEAEREVLQPFLYDVTLEVDEPAADTLAYTVDYREVVSLIREVSRSRQFQLLEALAGTLADELLGRFPVLAATVRVRKPHVELGLPVEYAAATVRRERR
ncbi:MAG TPA: dihydroneopterin aldolase [Gaiellaceae bacterium]|nr:dihydroneopterin aldolase [Gaiellaceae bacterium]